MGSEITTEEGINELLLTSGCPSARITRRLTVESIIHKTSNTLKIRRKHFAPTQSCINFFINIHLIYRITSPKCDKNRIKLLLYYSTVFLFSTPPIQNFLNLAFSREILYIVLYLLVKGPASAIRRQIQRVFDLCGSHQIRASLCLVHCSQEYIFEKE